MFLVSSAHSSFPSPHSGPRIHWWTIRTALQPVPPAAHQPLLLGCPTQSPRDRLIFLKLHVPFLLQRFSRPTDSKALHNLGFLHPPQSYPTGSECVFSDLIEVFSTQAHKQTATPPSCSLASSPDIPSFPPLSFTSQQQVQALASTVAFSELYCLTNICLFFF